jgi:hypothetical protein
MADVGGGGDLNGVDLTFDDEAAGGLPDSAQMRTGTYKPTQGTGTGSVTISAPAPAGPYGTSLTAFDGADPNGTYSLYVIDDSKNDLGQISGGFSVDITTGSAPPPADPTVASVAPQDQAANVALAGNVEATFSQEMDPTTINGSTFTLAKQGSSQSVTATVSYDSASKKATLDPNANLDPNATYTATVKGGAGGVKDLAGNSLAADKSWSFSTAVSSDRLPDLSMAQIQNLSVKSCTQTNFRDCAYVGQKQLRFDTRIVNVGAGSFEARGSRSSTSAPMTVTQRIYNDAGGFRTLPTTAQMYFAGDGHNHWHLRDLESYELVRLDNGTKIGAGAKEGFCFFDNVLFGSTQNKLYTSCGNDPSALNATMGLSRGWGDLYPSGTVGQYIDITNLASGRYKLQATADESDWFLESDNSNNFTWVEVQISGTKVSVVAYGPAAQPI